MNFMKNSLFQRNLEQEREEEMPEEGGVLAVWGSPSSGKTVVSVKLAEHLAASGDFLWIVDNVPPLRPADRRERILADWQAPAAQGRTLITSRDPLALAGYTPLALERAGLTLADLTLIDMHEAFAAQTLANLQCLASDRFSREVLGRAQATGEVDESKFNVLGGSIAYGHPFAATGARMITQTLHELRRRGGGFGLVTACAAGGLGAAMIVEAE